MKLKFDVTGKHQPAPFIFEDEGKIQTIPPDLKSLKKAQKGIYTLKSNGKQIENPDFVSSWSITKPQK